MPSRQVARASPRRGNRSRRWWHPVGRRPPPRRRRALGGVAGAGGRQRHEEAWMVWSEAARGPQLVWGVGYQLAVSPHRLGRARDGKQEVARQQLADVVQLVNERDDDA